MNGYIGGTYAQKPVAVKVEQIQRRSTAASEWDDAQAISRPDEVFCPTLLTWIEKGNELACRAINGRLRG